MTAPGYTRDMGPSTVSEMFLVSGLLSGLWKGGGEGGRGGGGGRWKEAKR